MLVCTEHAGSSCPTVLQQQTCLQIFAARAIQSKNSESIDGRNKREIKFEFILTPATPITMLGVRGAVRKPPTL